MSTNAAYRRRRAAHNIQVSQDAVPRYTETALSPLQAAATTEAGGHSEIYENLSTENTAHDGLAVELATNVACSYTSVRVRYCRDHSSCACAN